jgi:hypothetical protein
MECEMKKTKGLPKWFCLENYNDANSLTPLEWYENLNKRRMFFVYHSLSHSNRTDIAICRKERGIEGCKKFIDLITNNPIQRVANEKDIYYPRTTVRNLNNRSLEYNYQKLVDNAPPIFFDYLKLHNQSKDEANKLSYRDETLKNFFQSECSSWIPQYALAEVNLYATDEHIIEDFKIWLANTRSILNKKSAKKVFSVADFNEWAEYQILPYLDLKSWGLFSGCHLTQAMIGHALFPDEFDIDTTERIRRTTKKKADWLMNHTVLDALGVQLKKERLKI